MTLQGDLDQLEAEHKRENPYEKHYLLKNPFPAKGETAFDVCTDQEEIKDEFKSILGNFSPEAKRLRINGTNGAGKTNILRYFELLTNEARERGHIEKLYPIYVSAPGESYFEIHGQIVDKLEASFLEVLLKTLRSDPSLLDSLQINNELLMGLKALCQSGTIFFLPQQERKKDVFIRWLKGWKLTVADKKELTVLGWSPTDITSTSLAIRYLNDFLIMLKELALCGGIVLLLDEFEVIFQVLARARQSRYAQDLRHLLDLLKESVFFIIATVPDPKDLNQYPAIERRLGTTLGLQPIESPELATNFVSEYLNSARNRFETAQKEREKKPEHSRPTELEPLTPEIVEEEYRSLRDEIGEAEFDVLPGHFLPRMRERTKQIVEKGS